MLTAPPMPGLGIEIDSTPPATATATPSTLIWFAATAIELRPDEQ